jgi:hypothetical protein
MNRPRSHMYVNDWGETVALPSATVWEDTKTTRITYRGESGETFRAIVRQKPNPIGFHAKLPGDTRKLR